MTDSPRRRAVQPGAAASRRRRRSDVPRENRITPRYSDEELAQVLVFAAAARLAPAAYVAEASLRPSAWQVGRAPATGTDPEHVVEEMAAEPVLQDAPEDGEVRRMELLELMGIHRQLRGAATNLNQAVAKLHSLGEPVGELPAIAEYVRKVATAADEAVAAVRMRR
ncbi:hypothetical protein [Couchioplanes caeruleus]|uniref:Mobilization protein MobC n=1 Tax=Couchioplanes caeruleus TaxID=56438 RepID=A0A3N1FTE8_9ACTN|nr:hypothetical protein [Couchioplanes caeruleus]ROP21214.1 hypothetical protein EDD30_7608 [Couchioplanes caeruleus]